MCQNIDDYHETQRTRIERLAHAPRTDCGLCLWPGEHQMVDCIENLRQDIGKLRRAIGEWNALWEVRPLDSGEDIQQLLAVAHRRSAMALEETNGLDSDDDSPHQTHTSHTRTPPSFMQH